MPPLQALSSTGITGSAEDITEYLAKRAQAQIWLAEGKHPVSALMEYVNFRLKCEQVSQIIGEGAMPPLNNDGVAWGSASSEPCFTYSGGAGAVTCRVQVGGGGSGAGIKKASAVAESRQLAKTRAASKLLKMLGITGAAPTAGADKADVVSTPRSLFGARDHDASTKDDAGDLDLINAAAEALVLSLLQKTGTEIPLSSVMNQLNQHVPAWRTKASSKASEWVESADRKGKFKLVRRSGFEPYVRLSSRKELAACATTPVTSPAKIAATAAGKATGLGAAKLGRLFIPSTRGLSLHDLHAYFSRWGAVEVEKPMDAFFVAVTFADGSNMPIASAHLVPNSSARTDGTRSAGGGTLVNITQWTGPTPESGAPPFGRHLQLVKVGSIQNASVKSTAPVMERERATGRSRSPRRSRSRSRDRDEHSEEEGEIPPDTVEAAVMAFLGIQFHSLDRVASALTKLRDDGHLHAPLWCIPAWVLQANDRGLSLKDLKEKLAAAFPWASNTVKVRTLAAYLREFPQSFIVDTELGVVFDILFRHRKRSPLPNAEEYRAEGRVREPARSLGAFARPGAVRGLAAHQNGHQQSQDASICRMWATQLLRICMHTSENGDLLRSKSHVTRLSPRLQLLHSKTAQRCHKFRRITTYRSTLPMAPSCSLRFKSKSGKGLASGPWLSKALHRSLQDAYRRWGQSA